MSTPSQPSTSPPPNVCIPMHLDAFALSVDCCDGPSMIAPFTQPNYTALRLDSNVIQHDVLDHIDFHGLTPASNNPRLADIGLPGPDNLKKHRMGIHLHWSIPKFYRTAQPIGNASSTATAAGSNAAGGGSGGSGSNTKPSSSTGDPDPENPVYIPVPNRWLVTRHLKNRPQGSPLKEWQSWVVKSDAYRQVTAIPDDVDLESDVSPFVSYQGNPADQKVLNAQTEVFIGQKLDLKDWKGEDDKSPSQLRAMNSGNPLFVDYALHNCNVFSIIDSFAYKAKPNDPDWSFVDKAQCDYSVIGWHASPTDDPFNNENTLATRLSILKLKLDDASAKAYPSTSIKPMRCLLYGTIYDVSYDSAKKPRSLADEGYAKFTPEFNMEPLSVGTTPLDGILTFLEAHKADSDKFFEGQNITETAKELLQLSQLLYASADQYDARIEAQDLIAQQNFTKADGGSYWTYAEKAKAGNTAHSEPTSDRKSTLRDLNEAQRRLDICKRKLRSLQWDLFAEWWKFVSQYIPEDDKKDKTIADYKTAVDDIRSAIIGDGTEPGLKMTIKTLGKSILDLKTKVVAKIASSDPFSTRNDPTLCIAGLDSGRPADFTDLLTVNFDTQLKDDVSVVKSSIFSSTTPNPVPVDSSLDQAALRLLASSVKNSNTTNGVDKPPTTTGYIAWGQKNPFVPLFIEWEALYFHIDKSKWSVAVRPSPVGLPHSQVRYVPNVDLLDDSPINIISPSVGTSDASAPTQPQSSAPKKPDSALSAKPKAPGPNLNDARAISGRVLILPQPVFDLNATVRQVLDNTSIDVGLSEDEKTTLEAALGNMKFVSAPLAGLRNHLITRFDGAHVKPNVRIQGRKTVPLDVAVSAAGPIKMKRADLELIDSESGLTPYGTSVAFGHDQPRPFKGVTHGQMMFTKLNIVDKFGQAICLPKPAPRLRQPQVPPPASIFPCLSDYLSPDLVEDSNRLNAVSPIDPVTKDHWPLCQYIQLTPSINQDARINGAFLTRDTVANNEFGPWREASDYEQPVWGWIIINYADRGLQFFLPDGTFYTEIRQGGVSGASVASKWLPYGPPAKLPPSIAALLQLNQFIAKFSAKSDTTGAYLQSFFDVINGSIQNMPFPPSSYSGFANAIVGKPLALVNAGWSIELAAPAIKPQNSLGQATPTPLEDLQSYSFPLKIGDIERSFDGVVGYFPNSTKGKGGTDFSQFYTYFMPDPAIDGFVKIEPTNFPPLQAYYIDPEMKKTPNMADAHNLKYTVTSLLVDPYTPIHAYSPILPTKRLKLPNWVVQEAFKNMHAFFHLGPSLVTLDVPPTYAAAKAAAAPPPEGAKNTKQKGPPPVRLPVSGAKGTWTWLQPYATDSAVEAKFAPLPVREDVGKTKFMPAPYTFLEGYLQLTGSLAQDAGSTGSASS